MWKKKSVDYVYTSFYREEVKISINKDACNLQSLKGNYWQKMEPFVRKPKVQNEKINEYE